MQHEPRWGKEIAAAYVAAQAEMPEITKGRKANVGNYSYTYADLGDTINAVRPVLVKHGLAIAQDVSRHERMIEVFTMIVHRSGESVSFGPMGVRVRFDSASVRFGGDVCSPLQPARSSRVGDRGRRRTDRSERQEAATKRSRRPDRHFTDGPRQGSRYGRGQVV